MESIFSYIPGDSFIHRLNPLTKLIAAFVICVAAAVCTNIPFEIAMIVVLMLFAQAVGGFRQCLKMVLALGSLACIVLVLQVVFVHTGDVWLDIRGFTITSGGVLSGVMVVLKVVCMVLPLTLAFMSTPLTDLTNVLVQKCRLPYKYAFTITTAIRFIPVFAEEMNGIIEAQKARGVEFDGNIVKRVRLMIPLAVPLLVGSVKRTDAIAISAEIRGFNLRTRESGWKRYPFHANDVVAAIVCVALIAAVIAVNML